MVGQLKKAVFTIRLLEFQLQVSTSLLPMFRAFPQVANGETIILAGCEAMEVRLYITLPAIILASLHTDLAVTIWYFTPVPPIILPDGNSTMKQYGPAQRTILQVDIQLTASLSAPLDYEVSNGILTPVAMFRLWAVKSLSLPLITEARLWVGS